MEIKGLGKRIHQVRKERNLTAEQLSGRCNINAVYLRQIEGGTKTPSLPIFVVICNALQISPDYLLQDELNSNELSSIHEVEELWKYSSPGSQDLVLDILKTVLSHVEQSR